MILVDTSIWIDFLVDPERILEAELHIAEFVTCSPIVQEVLQGFDRPQAYKVFRDRLLTFPRLSDPLPLDLYLEAAEIYHEGRRRAYTIRSAMDCLIAAIAIRHDVSLWHRDRDFVNIARYTKLRAVSKYIT